MVANVHYNWFLIHCQQKLRSEFYSAFSSRLVTLSRQDGLIVLILSLINRLRNHSRSSEIRLEHHDFDRFKGIALSAHFFYWDESTG